MDHTWLTSKMPPSSWELIGSHKDCISCAQAEKVLWLVWKEQSRSPKSLQPNWKVKVDAQNTAIQLKKRGFHKGSELERTFGVIQS